MKFVQATRALRMVALVGIAAPLAVAQDPGWYLGANVGWSRTKIDEIRVTNTVLGDPYVTTSILRQDHDAGFKVFLGYRINPFFGLEGGYFDLGKFGFTSTTLPPGTLNGEIKLKGLNFDAVLHLPLTDSISAFGRVGVNYAEAKDTFRGTGLALVAAPDVSKRESNIKFGVGFQFDVTESLGIRAEVERYKVNDAVGHKGDTDLASLGMLVRFGTKSHRLAPIARGAEPVPASSAPLSEAEPAAVVVPVPARTQQYCTILDIQFEIDADDIQREEKEKLGVVGTFLTKYPETRAVIEGHTDNTGASEHNLALSQGRANSVANYLVDTLHIDRSRITAIGFGDTRPIADNSTELGKRRNRRIDAVIACVTDVEGLTVVPARMTMAMLIEFDRNDAEIKPSYREEFRKVADFLKANPSATATVEGHTGNLQATRKLAMEISQRRAEHVVNYLVENFYIDRSRLSAEGFGQSRRFAYNTSAESQQENRRVNIIINYPK